MYTKSNFYFKGVSLSTCHRCSLREEGKWNTYYILKQVLSEKFKGKFANKKRFSFKVIEFWKKSDISHCHSTEYIRNEFGVTYAIHPIS